MSDLTRLTVIGVPSSAGARRSGQEQGPHSLRRAGLLEHLRTAGLQVIDYGDLPLTAFTPDPDNPKRQNVERVKAVNDRVAAAVHEAATGDSRLLVIGGDCTITLGVLSALTKSAGRLGLLYFDGDLDLNTPETTCSGILDGMVLAHVLGEGDERLCHWGPRPMIEPENIVLFGYSEHGGGIDPPEIERLAESVMVRYPMENVRGKAAAAACEALRYLESRTDRILVHFDLDVIDADDFSAVDVPHRPGLPLADAREALEIFLGSDKVTGVVVTEFNAARDPAGVAARTLVDLLIVSLDVTT